MNGSIQHLNYIINLIQAINSFIFSLIIHTLIFCQFNFIGVIFALKVLTTYYWPVAAYSNVFGIPMAARHAVWAELIFIQIVSPNASFIGHLSGILVGLAYCKGPLRAFIDLTYRKSKVSLYCHIEFINCWKIQKLFIFSSFSDVLTAPIGLTDHQPGPQGHEYNYQNFNEHNQGGYNRYYGGQASYEEMRRRRGYNQPGFFGFNQGPFFRSF